MTVLITHEWIAKTGGSENVFEQIGLALPSADQFCLWNEDPQRFPRARETWLSRSPLRRNKALALPFLRSALRSVPVEDYDVVVASSHAFGHYNAYRAVENGSLGFAYVHSPARYIWAPEHDERGQSIAVRAVSPGMRWMDRRTTSSKVHYAANSEFVRRRIQKSWGVDAEVIYPPVAVEEITASLATPMTPEDSEIVEQLPADYVLGASRLVPYKRVDLVIRVAARLNRPVVVAGDGPERRTLEELAKDSGVPAIFLGRVSDRLLHELYRRTALFVFLSIEDFGIMPAEAVAAGAPVLVNARGGAWEGVAHTGAGLRCDGDSMDSLVSHARQAISLKSNAGPDALLEFSNGAFRDKIRDWIGLEAS